MQTVAVCCRRLLRRRHGKEGVDGSSPSEGSAKSPLVGNSCSARLARSALCGGYGAVYGAFAFRTPPRVLLQELLPDVLEGRIRSRAHPAYRSGRADRLNLNAIVRPGRGRRLTAPRPLVGGWEQTPLSARMAQSNQRAPAEVGDQKADLARTDRLRKLGGEHVDRSDRRRRLDRRQQRIQVHRRSHTRNHLGKPSATARLLAVAPRR